MEGRFGKASKQSNGKGRNRYLKKTSINVNLRKEIFLIEKRCLSPQIFAYL